MAVNQQDRCRKDETHLIFITLPRLFRRGLRFRTQLREVYRDAPVDPLTHGVTRLEESEEGVQHGMTNRGQLN